MRVEAGSDLTFALPAGIRQHGSEEESTTGTTMAKKSGKNVYLEALLLFFPAFMTSGMWDTAVNILVSFVCAVQVESFRKVNGHSVATTMCTGNLRSATEQIFHYVRTRDPDTRKTILSYYEIVVFFALGATLGAALSALFAEKAILFCCLFLIIAFLSMFAKEI